MIQLCNSVGLQPEFGVELDLDMDDVARFRGWHEWIAVGCKVREQ